jgi:vacuolar-type H+-ATPase subunit I/STV1
VHQDAAPAETCPAGDLNLASVLAKLRDRASVAGRESVELKAQSERAAELADLLNSVAEAITGRVRDRDALLEAQRQLDDKHASLLETERRLTKSQELGGEFREENLGLRKRLEASECNEAAQAGRLSELTRKGALDQMQKYAQTRLEEFRSVLARALHPSVHDLPQTLAELPPDLAGVIAIRLEQVIRELERHQIPLRSKREATG